MARPKKDIKKDKLITIKVEETRKNHYKEYFSNIDSSLSNDVIKYLDKLTKYKES